MGYTMEFYAVSLESFTAELRRPQLDPASFEARAGIDDEVVAGWTPFASAVAGAVAAGGGELVWPLSGYVHQVLRQVGNWYGAWSHTSSGGEQFRSQFLPGPVAQVIGLPAARSLVNRELIGLSWTEYPMFGWLSNAELRAVAGVQDLPEGIGEEDEADLWTLIDVIDRAAVTGQDLVTMYG